MFLHISDQDKKRNLEKQAQHRAAADRSQQKSYRRIQYKGPYFAN